LENEWLLLDQISERWRWLKPVRHVPWLRDFAKVVLSKWRQAENLEEQ
jgi:hypothetical protein